MFQIRRRLFSLSAALPLILLAVLSISVASVGATGSTVQSCAVTPNLLGGQGFSVSGQGFSVSGQGFSVSGQGFSVSGQGFSVSGQGLDPLVVAAEIRDNPITPGKWVNDRLDLFLGKMGFNTSRTAILIIDEFGSPDAHGFEVKKVVDDSLTTLRGRVPGLNIEVFAVDISDSTANYNGDAIAAKIIAKVNELKGGSNPYRNFILNMSFGLIDCNDDGPVIGGFDLPAFNFNQAAQVIEQQNSDVPASVKPMLECVVDKGYGQYAAYFGYQNDNSDSVNIPVGYHNKFTPEPKDRGQPTFFEPGRQRYVFKVIFNGSNLTWTLKGPDGVSRTVTASSAPSQRCTSTPPHPTQPVTPILECVEAVGEGMYEARFGYNNPNSVGVSIPVGYHNKFSPSPENRGQPAIFAPGKHENVFEVYFSGSSLVWKLKDLSTVAATSSSPACAEQKAFGMGEYFTQSLGVPQNLVDDYWRYLTQQVENDPSQTLRTLLQDYLELSADPSQNFTAFAVASAGNLKPWMGDAPLAPASWVETIAISASVGDSDRKWSFSQKGNIIVPGAGYPLGFNERGAGTSFSAPAFSVLASLCATIPGGLQYNGTLPPLVRPLVNGQKNLTDSPISTFSLAPLNCVTQNAATEVPIDIKPLLPLNIVNINSHGILRMAILSTATFDAKTVKPESVTLAGASAQTRHWEFYLRFWDVNHDGRKDQVLRFRIQDMQLTSESTQAEMNGETYGGVAVHGVDRVRIIPSHVPIPVLPFDTATVRLRNIKLFWLSVDEEEEATTCFQVQVDNNSNFSSPEQSAVTVNLTNYTTRNLNNGQYYWRVAVSDCSTGLLSGWSEVWSFTLK